VQSHANQVVPPLPPIEISAPENKELDDHKITIDPPLPQIDAPR